MKYFRKENVALEEKIDSYFEAIEKYNREHFEGKLSVMLLGSLSRGEATWVKDGENDKMLSDIEYFTIYPDGFIAFSEYNEMCERAKNEVFGNQKSSLFHIDNTFVKKEALCYMERKLITYDAKCMGKTVVGEDCIKLLPEITIENINLCDIKDILTHRIFYVLYYGKEMRENGKTEEYKYLLSKNSLDLMTVILAHYGKIASGFVKRFEIIKDLDIPEEWKNYFAYCLSVKLSEPVENSYAVNEMENIFIEIVEFLHKNFKVPLKNVLLNRRHVLKRRMGIVKRAIKYCFIPRFRHLKGLIKIYDKDKVLKEINIKNNLIINGYPII
ncbi:MAG: hypothetical protein Q4G23_09265 [Clostridia bacterium]|nr:hypothetical protein [Clostridia bacterium]